MVRRLWVMCISLSLIIGFMDQPSFGKKRPDPDMEKCKCYIDGYNSYRSDLTLENTKGATKDRCYSWGMKAHWDYGWNERKERPSDCPFHEYFQ